MDDGEPALDTWTDVQPPATGVNAHESADSASRKRLGRTIMTPRKTTFLYLTADLELYNMPFPLLTGAPT